MTDIPEDIEARARELAQDVKYCACSMPDYEGGNYIEWDDEEFTKQLAAALLTERRSAEAAMKERCAVVAESLGDTWSGSRDVMSCVQEAAVDDKCIQIAAAIRGME